MSKKTGDVLQTMIKDSTVRLPKFNPTYEHHLYNDISPTYYDRLIGHVDASFANLIHLEESIQDGLKTKKLKGLSIVLV